MICVVMGIGVAIEVVEIVNDVDVVVVGIASDVTVVVVVDVVVVIVAVVEETNDDDDDAAAAAATAAATGVEEIPILPIDPLAVEAPRA